MTTKIFSDFIYSAVCLFLPIKQSVKMRIPYYAQRESPQLVDDIIKKRIRSRDDPKWAQSGAKNPIEYEYWCRHICGMACLKMILKDFLNKEYRTIDLAKDASLYGAYIPKKNTVDGLLYAPFCAFLTKEFKIRSQYRTIMNQRVIKHELSKGNYVFVSVNQNIREGGINRSKIKNGHLVLITGYNEISKKIYLHNPSGYYNKSQINQPLSYVEFESFFGHRGIIIYKH